jgi:hypothetical protein
MKEAAGSVTEAGLQEGIAVADATEPCGYFCNSFRNELQKVTTSACGLRRAG